MKPYSTFKQKIKDLRWQARRVDVARHWGKQALKAMPAVLGNAMPKSGSHLIIQVLLGLTKIGPFVNPGFPPVNRSEENERLPDQAILKNLLRMQPGDIAYGYIQARQPFISTLTAPGRATVFVYRDPRDMIVSHVFYATEMHAGHGMHKYYTEDLQTMEQRISAAIQGVQQAGSELSSVRQRYENYMGWLEQPTVLCLRFEDLVLNRETAFGQLLDYLETHGFVAEVPRNQAVDALKEAVIPKKSGTYRKGKPGNWQEYFTEANKTLFKEYAGNLLIQLGYEIDNTW